MEPDKPAWKVEILDSNRRPMPDPIYLGKIKPGTIARAYFYIRNHDHEAEDIKIRFEPEWVRLVRAPERLPRGHEGQVVIEMTPPLWLGNRCLNCPHSVDWRHEGCAECDCKEHDDGPPALRVFATANVRRVLQ